MNEVMTTLFQGSKIAYISQVLVIFALFLIGHIFVQLIRDRISGIWTALLSYPVGLAFYALSGYTLLLVGIRFEVMTILIFMGLVMILLGIIRIKRGKSLSDFDVRTFVLSGLAAFLIALIAASGLLPVAVSNDSVYYYSTYPAILTSEKFYVSTLDSFLSNVGQTTAVVNCLPFLFGFDETFGIQWFLNINFVLIFFEACMEEAQRRNITAKMAAAAAVLSALVLATSEPFLGTAVWVLSNAYFMEYFFVAFYLAVKMAEEDTETSDYLVIQALFVGMISMLRMEGGVIMTVFTVLISVYKTERKKLLLTYCLPLFLTVAGYYMMFFGRMGIDPLYSFLDWKKAAMMIAMVAGLVVYVAVIRRFVPGDYIPTLLVALLLLGNAGIFVISRERYVTDVKAFILNVRQGNGWGIFGTVVLILFIFTAVDFIKNKGKLSCVSAVVPVVILSSIAVCWARGGVLAIRMSDSGNRVMMQIAPLVVFVLYRYVLEISGFRSIRRQDR